MNKIFASLLSAVNQSFSGERSRASDGCGVRTGIFIPLQKRAWLRFAPLVALFLAVTLPQAAWAASGTKNNTATMNLASDWSNGVLGTGDIGTFDTTISTANAAALQLGGSISIGELSFGTISGPVTIGNTGVYTLTLNGVAGTGIDMSAASQNVTINSIVDLAASQKWNVVTGRTLTVGGVISGSGGLTKEGAGKLSLSKAMTSTGGVTVNAGELALTIANCIGYAITINAGATISMNSGNQIANTVTSFTINGGVFNLGGKTEGIETAINLNDGTITGSLNSSALTATGGFIGTGNNNILKIIDIKATNGGLFNIISGTTTDAASITGSTVLGNLTKSGDGRLVLSGVTTYAGATTVSAGTLQLKYAASLAHYNNTGSATTVNGTGVLAVNAGAAGEWTSVEIGDLLGNAAVTFAAGTRFGIDTTGGDFTHSTAITKANMGFVKLGANKLTLEGANTYTGATTISSGTLFLGASGSISTSATIDVASGAYFDVSAVTGGFALGASQVLNGTGTVVGPLTVSGKVAPGNSIGTIHFTSDLTLTGTFAIELDGTGTGSNDVIAMNGNALDITAGTVDFNTLVALDDAAYVFVTGYGTLIGTKFAAENNIPGGYKINYKYLGANDIALEVVPEPSTSAMVGLGILGMLMLRRLRRK